MQKYAGSCSPEQVHMLQSICDVILRELQAKGSIGEADDIILLRDVIARRVMSQFYGADFTPSDATEAVRLSLGIGPAASEGQSVQAPKGWYSPEELLTIQDIFDLVWSELRGRTSNSPSNNDLLRNEIGRRIFHQFLGADFTREEAVVQLLNSFARPVVILPMSK